VLTRCYGDGVFSVKLVARPDARMVEVPLEIEAELPREFDGAALLASSGLPRKVRIKAQRDALKLSTAYRADQLMADIVRISLRGTVQDAARVQEATRAFIRTVRERRQDGATLVVSSNGRGKIEVVEQLPAAKPRSAPVSEPPREAPRPSSQVTLADRLAAVERRLDELESGFARMAASDPEERLAHLEGRLGALQSRTDLAGPMIEAHAGSPATQELSRTPGAPRRTTAVEAFAEGLRNELRVRVTGQLERAALATETCDRAAALAAEAESVLGAPRDGTAERLRMVAAAAAARRAGLSRVAEELDLYQPADLGIAAQLVSRLEAGAAAGSAAADPAPALALQAEALVRAARGPDASDRASWLRRAAALCGWTLIEPQVGGEVQPDLAQSIQGGGGGSSVVAVASPGLRSADGAVLVRARVQASAAEMADEEVEVLATSGAGEQAERVAAESEPVALEPVGLASVEAAAPEAPAGATAREPEVLHSAEARELSDLALNVVPESSDRSRESSAEALPHSPDAPKVEPEPAVSDRASAAAHEPSAAPAPFGDLTGNGDISPDEAAAAAAAGLPRVVHPEGAAGREKAALAGEEPARAEPASTDRGAVEAARAPGPPPAPFEEDEFEVRDEDVVETVQLEPDSSG
jgi:hypothetical protein